MALVLTSMIATSCNGKGGGQSTSDGGGSVTVDEVAAGYLRYDVAEPLARKTEGFGTQFDTCIIEAINGLTEEEWQIQVNAIKEMNLQNVRVRFFPELYERKNDNSDPNVFDFDSENVDFESLDMQLYYKLFDVFEENGVKVDLSWYGCRTTFESLDGTISGSWLGGTYEENNSWCVAPQKTQNPNEEFAESVAACLKYLTEVKGYTCIYEYSIFPEPEGVFSGNPMPDYKNVAEIINRKLIEYGIEDKFIFSGPADYGNNPENLENKYLSQMEIGKATSSVYPFNAQTEDAVMLDYAQLHAGACDKYGISWGIAECGTSNFLTPVTNSDSGTYDRALFMARFFTNMVNGGCTNIKYFVFSDCYYDGSLNELGLFKFRQDGWKAKPVWYSWSLICKYTDFGSEVFPITTSFKGNVDKNVAITALKLPDGSWTYVATNNDNVAKKIALVNVREDRASTMNYFRVSGANIPEDGALKTITASSTVDTSGGVAYFNIPAKGFVVLSDKQI